jgi:non-heme chloroperoxidase
MKITIGKENSTPIHLYYEDHGKGQPVVLIHGFPLSGGAWEKEVAALLKAGYRTITYDRRGFGNSSKTAKGYDYDTFAADLDKLMTELDLRDVCLVGHSMGTGEVGRYISHYGSERVSGAVFISPLEPFLLKTDGNQEGVDQSVFDGIKEAIRKDRLAYLTSFLHDFYNLDVTLGKLVSKEVVQYNWNVAAGASPIGTLNCVSTWLTDFREDIPRIDVPSLIIQGDADRILPLQSTGERFHKLLKGSELVVLKDASHGIPWTHAEDINRELLKFLSQIPAEKSKSWASTGPH